VHGTGLHVGRNSEAVNPEARSRAGRPCVGGSKSRNRLSEGLAWPVFFIRGVRPASQDFIERLESCYADGVQHESLAHTNRIFAEDAFTHENFPNARGEYATALQACPYWPAGHFNVAVPAGEMRDFRTAAVHMKCDCVRDRIRREAGRVH